MAAEDAADPGDLDDDLPPLLGEDGEELPPEPQEPTPPTTKAEPASAAANVADASEEPYANDEDASLRAVAALRAAAALQEATGRDTQGEGSGVSATDALKSAMDAVEEPKTGPKELDEVTKRMIDAIAKDDFDECESTILQGADVNVDCGAGTCAIHLTALRGEMFLTELLLEHKANVNQRDSNGNTPLLYACHFYRQNGRGVQLTAQLLHHKADPFYRVKEGKYAGQSALDLAEKACAEPNTDENVPIQMRAMIKLAMEGGESSQEVITRMWMNFKSKNKRLYEMTSKKDNFDYAMQSIDWVTPANAKNAQAATPVKLEDSPESILEEKFALLTDYSFSDEGDKVKLYVTFPENAAAALNDKSALTVDFDFQSFDLKLRAADEQYRLRIEPLYGSIDVDQCKHRISAASRKVTLTLAKRHKNRKWSTIQKGR